MEEVLLSCPSCNRDFELPRKCMRADDMDYLTLPRLLPCLHTACHSCLCEMRERSELGKVVCPVCRKDHNIKGVEFLPLDVSVLKKVLDTGSADKMSFCSRCYDEVPSYSWCFHCSVALCEFHHQDHKLSVDTSRHDVMTFKEVQHRNMKVRPKLPPMTCPEVHTEEVNAYCHKCEHLVSVHGALQNHAQCETVDCKTGLDHAMRSLEYSTTRADKFGGDLKVAVRAYKNRLAELESEVDRANFEIEEEFDSLRRIIDEREKEMKNRVEGAASKKREVLVAQLKALTERLEETGMAHDISENGRKDTEDMVTPISGGPAITSEQAAYVVGLAGPVKTSLDSVAKAMEEMSMQPSTDTTIAVSFANADIISIKTRMMVLGSVQTLEDNAEFGLAREDVKGLEQGTHFHSAKGGTVGKKIAPVDAVPLIHFNIKVDPSSADSLTTEKSAAAAQKKGSIINNIVIEARAAHSTGDKKAIKEGRSVNEGKLLGQVILATELDRRLVNRHEIRSFYESVVIRNIPIVKLSKEFIPKAYDNGLRDNFSSSPTDRDGFAGRRQVTSVSPGKGDSKDRYGQGPDPEAKKISMLHQHRANPNVRHLHHYNHL